MRFDLHIKNFGKLEDARIRLGNFTVFAGKNNTGKSYVSKLLYSLFNSMNANHAGIRLGELTRPVTEELMKLFTQVEFVSGQGPDKDKWLPSGTYGCVPQILGHIQAMRDIVRDCYEENDEYGAYEYAFGFCYHELKEKAAKIREIYDTGRHNGIWGRAQDKLDRHVGELCKQVENMDPQRLIIAGVESKIYQNLIGNFQIPNLSSLEKKPGGPTTVDMTGVGKMEFTNGKVALSPEITGLEQLHEYSRVIYLESPVYWKLKPALDNITKRRRLSSSRRKGLTGIPDYFYDLSIALGETYSGDIAFPDLLRKLIGDSVLSGQIVISGSGELVFQENSRPFPLSLTAMGIINLGILALLIERKVVDKGSLVFIDEPEAHLHPAWQVVMAETLFELAKGGANVVIATHSVDILKWLEVHIKKHPEDEKLVALNKFPVNGDESVEQDFDYKMAAIKGELTEPFANLYTAGL